MWERPALVYAAFSAAAVAFCALIVHAPRNLNMTFSSAQASRLEVETIDAQSRNPVHARIYLTDSAGKLHVPPGAISYTKGKESHFISTGRFAIELPAGEYKLTAERGTEYHSIAVTLNVESGKAHKKVLRLKRWAGMNARGWYSGDLHVHRSVDEIPALMLAEDLNLAPAINDWIWEDKQLARPVQSTDSVRKIDSTHAYSVLDKEVERLGPGPGAVDLLGLKSPVPFEGYLLYPPNSVYCKAARDQGGYVDAEKIVWRDIVALIALGHIDFAGIVYNHFNRHDVLLETDRWGMIPKERPEFNTVAGMPIWAMEVYYRFLNCGFRLPVSAGSASGVMQAPIGYCRVYVKLDEAFDYHRWFRALKAGRSFATNGPMLFMTVNGEGPGGEINLHENDRVKVKVEAESAGQLDRLDIIVNGRIVKSESSIGGVRKLKAEITLNNPESGWVAARCFERPGTTIRFAHTSPVYLKIGSKKLTPQEDARYFIKWIDREIAHYRKQDGFRAPSHRDETIAFFESARKVYSSFLLN